MGTADREGSSAAVPIFDIRSMPRYQRQDAWQHAVVGTLGDDEDMSAGLSLDEIVQVSAIIEQVVRRPLTPSESARLKMAWAGRHGLAEIAESLD